MYRPRLRLIACVKRTKFAPQDTSFHMPIAEHNLSAAPSVVLAEASVQFVNQLLVMVEVGSYGVVFCLGDDARLARCQVQSVHIRTSFRSHENPSNIRNLRPATPLDNHDPDRQIPTTYVSTRLQHAKKWISAGYPVTAERSRLTCELNRWAPSNTSKSSRRRSRAMCSASFSVCAAGRYAKHDD